MKTAVVYYSYDGSTRVAAEVLAEKLNADIFELEEIKTRRHGPAAFMGAGFAAASGLKSRLKNTYAKEMADYERICIGTPIWASQCVPAVNAFVNTAELKDKDAIIFTLQADRAPEKAQSAQRLKKTLEKKGVASFSFIRLVGASPGKTAIRDDVLKQVEEKLELKKLSKDW